MTNFEARLAALPPEKRALVLQQLKQKRAEAQNKIHAQPRTGEPFPLSYGQERMWFLYQLDPQSALYNVSVTVCLSGQLDVERLRQALTLLVQRHEALRTTFAMANEQPMQWISADAELALEISDLTAVAQPEATFYQQAKIALQRPFDLETGPVFRAHLYQLDNSEARLLLVMHHIVSDGWSVGVLAKEMAELYRALSENRAPSLPPLPVQCADFAVWQRQWLQGRNLETLAQYWQKQLAQAPPLLELPTDAPRPAEQSFQGERLPFALSDQLYQQTKQLSQQEGATLFMVLFTGFAILLSRLAQQDDVIIGTPITNRKQPEIMGVIGAFVNTLALRVDLSGNPTYRQLLQQVRQTALDGYAHEAMPFAHLVDLLKLPRSLSHSPLFQVSFGLQDNPLQAIEMPNLSVSLLEVRSLLQEGALPPLDTGQAMFDLTFHLSEIAEGVGGWIEYSTDLFTAVTIQQISQQYQALLSQIVANPDAPLAQLSLLDPASWQQVVVDWNQTSRPLAGPATLHQLFEQQASQFGSSTAVRQLNRDDQLQASLTFAQLDQQANQLARYLQQQGIGPEKLVGLCAERSTEMVVGLLAILKAGGGYVPLPPDYPTERLLYMANDAQLALILSETALLPRLTEANAPVFCLDQDWGLVADLDTTAVANQANGDNVAYVIYTSGSTGLPKGVMVRHRNIVNLVHAQIDAFALSPQSRVLQFAVLGFDAAVSEIFTTLISGATLVLAHRDRLVPGDDFVALLNQEAISTITLPPSALRVMDSQQLPQLRTLVSAGEACPVDLAHVWSQNRRFLNFYGPTEATVGCCYQLVDEATRTAVADSVPIGRPIANVQLYIFDQYGQPLPPGVPGELVVGGAGVARGYLNRPELTAEKFIPDPFSADAEARLYRTGDRVVYDRHGRLRFLGRTDHQVKLRGFRIELGEIEAVLGQHTAVAEAIVLAAEQDGRAHLTAYFVASQEPAPALSELRHFLGQQLPDYMIPAYFVPVSSWPLTANGKIDRHALAQLASQRLHSESDFTASRNQIEAHLVTIWQSLLQLEQVGVHDNFFELGGDSILSIQMVARARAQNIQLSPRQIFQHQTIAELAAVAGQAQKPQAEQGLVTGEVPLTAVQQWFLAANDDVPQQWNQAVMLHLSRPLQWAHLEAAVTAVVQQHDALRLRFHWQDGRWQQTHGSVEGTAVVQRVDLSQLPAAEQAQAVEQAASDAQQALNIGQGPVWRLLYFTGGTAVAERLLCVAHHLVVDAVSWRILLEDLQTAYTQLSQGEPLQLPAKTTSFKQWATAVAAYAQSEEVTATLTRWQPQVAIAPLPVDTAVGQNLAGDEAIWQTTLAAEQTQALLQDVPPVYHTQMNDVLLAALLLAMHEWGQINSLWIDLEGHGRESWDDALDISRTVGWFTTIYPVQLQLPQPSHQLGELLKAVKEQLRAVPHNGFSYGLLRYINPGTGRILSQLPTPQISFNYLGQMGAEQGEWQLSQESVGPTRQANSARAHLIEIESQISQGELHTVWRYNCKAHQSSSVQRLAALYSDKLTALIAHCQNPEAGGYTPSDFPEANLDQQRLDNALAELFGD